MTPSAEPVSRMPLRLWPGVAVVTVQVLIWLGVMVAAPESAMLAVLAGAAGGLVVLIWWLFFSRAPWLERLAVVVLMVAAVALTRLWVHPSISNGMMGLLVPIHAPGLLSLALVGALIVTRHGGAGARRFAIAGGIVIACGLFTLIRTDGITGDGASAFHWRWTPTAEERLLASSADMALPAAAAPAVPVPPVSAAPAVMPPDPGRAGTAAPDVARVDAPVTAEPEVPRAEWPGFRGPKRDGVARGATIDTDWTSSPPVELWRRPIGPGWSSFAVAGDFIYTQEQRGDDEVVSCYQLSTGEPVWAHRDPVRFWESNGGAGPRATPTVDGDRVYALGATGLLNALDRTTGALLWSRNAASETDQEVPGWGFAGSPLVVDDIVIVALSGRLAAYDAGTGEPRWMGPPQGGGYSSPHLATIHGVPQVILLRGARTTSVRPADGRVLWEHVGDPGVSIVQPAVVGDDVLIGPGDAMGGAGMRRLLIAHDAAADTWTVTERWATRGLKPYFNDFVVHEGHAYGFDGSILSSVSLADGARAWKGGRYGAGQMILLPDQDLLLVLAEEGGLALVRAAPDAYSEVARAPAIEGKTWNHPVLVGHVLLVRNGEEMAAFRLPAGR